MLLKWIDHEGQNNQLELLEQISSKWRRVGMLFGEKMAALDNCEQKSNDNVDRCARIFSHWIECKGHPNYPLTWDGLSKLLRDIKQETAAARLQEALKMILNNDS